MWQKGNNTWSMNTSYINKTEQLGKTQFSPRSVISLILVHLLFCSIYYIIDSFKISFLILYLLIYFMQITTTTTKIETATWVGLYRKRERRKKNYYFPKVNFCDGIGWLITKKLKKHTKFGWFNAYNKYSVITTKKASFFFFYIIIILDLKYNVYI